MPSTTDAVVISGPSPEPVELDERRLAASVAVAQQLWTYQDAIEHVLDAFDVPRDSRALRLARRAVQRAWRVLPTYHDWPFYASRVVLNLVAPVSDGEVTFDLTGGAFENLVTLSGSTWPTWAAFGTLEIDDTHYPVLGRIDSTRITLDSRRRPPEDLSATSYRLFRDRYPLPLDFRRSDQVLQPSTDRWLDAVHPTTAQESSVYLSGESQPYMQTVVGDDKYVGGLAMQFVPMPASDEPYVFYYRRGLRPLRTEKYTTGTVSISNGSATVTGDETAFTTLHKGCVLRISTDDEEPTSHIGSVATGEIHEPAFERIVTDVNSATELILSETLTETASDRAFTLSDPIDVHYETMLDVFLRLCELEFARLVGRADVAERQVMFMLALDECREAVRHSSVIQHANIGEYTEYSLLGEVDSRPS